jgi:hypothetical protein
VDNLSRGHAILGAHFNETPEGASQAFAAVNLTAAAYRASAPDYAAHLKEAAKE